MKIIDNLSQAAMRNRQLVLSITFVLILAGFVSLQIMPRNEFPEFTVRQGLIVGVFPGASSDQVEEQLTTKVENYLFGFEEVDRQKTYSISREGMMYLLVELRPQIKDADKFWVDFRHGLNELKMTLPQEVLALIANNDFGDAAALILTLQSSDRPYRDLEKYLEVLEDELRTLPAASKIKHFGLQKEQISIYIDNEKLAFYGINPATVLAVLKMEGSVSYAGNIDNNKVSLPIHLPPRYQTENDLAAQIIYTDPRGVAIRLKDVARVVREYEKPDSYVQIDGKNCVILTLEMLHGHNIVEFGKEVDGILEEISADFPPDVQVTTIANMPHAVSESVNTFLEEFIIAILAVIAITMILLPMRVASIAAVTIPISVLITLGILHAAGIELHTVSLAALIVVLGMVVDNTIVIVDNYIDKLDHGVEPWDAAWRSVSDLFIPVLSATIAIIAVFVPMGFFLDGIAGDFVGTFPLTISITLGVSLLVAVLIVPILTFGWIKRGLRNQVRGVRTISFLDRFQFMYDRLIDLSFKHKGLVLTGAVVLMVITVLLGSRLSSQFGPMIERDQFAVEIFLAEGSSLDKTTEAVNHLQEQLLKDSRVAHVTAFVGTSSPRFHTLYAPNIPAKNYAQLIVNTTTIYTANELLDDYSANYVSPVPQADIRWKQLQFTLATAPIVVRISGNDIPELKQTSEEVNALMRQYEGITWIRNDYKGLLPGVQLVMNEDEANRLGLTKAMIAYTVAMGMKGLPLSTVWEGNYPIDVVLRQEKSRTTEIEDLGDIYIASPFSFTSTRARQVTTSIPEWSEGQIVRRNGVRTLTVSADVARSAAPFDIFKQLKPQIDKLQLAKGVSISYGGEHQTEIENYVPFLYSLITSIILIFFVLLFQFKTIRLSLIVMITVPLSMFGAVIGLMVMNYPFSMTAFIGIISLVGMVIRNGIIYVDYAEQLRKKQGVDLTMAAIAAGKRRMRPIFLTSAAAAVGVIPMIVSHSPLWAPLGIVLSYGLIFTMGLTLIILPVVYGVFGPKTLAVNSERGSA